MGGGVHWTISPDDDGLGVSELVSSSTFVDTYMGPPGAAPSQEWETPWRTAASESNFETGINVSQYNHSAWDQHQSAWHERAQSGATLQDAENSSGMPFTAKRRQCDNSLTSSLSSTFPVPSSSTTDFAKFMREVEAAASSSQTPSYLDSTDSAFEAIEADNSSGRANYGFGSSSTSLTSGGSTPCPTTSRIFAGRTTGRKSVFFTKKRSSGGEDPIMPQASWLKFPDSDKGTPNASDASTEFKHSENILSLANLRDIEKRPRHLWSIEERDILCVLHRWYEELSTEELGTLFNSIAGLTLEARIVRLQLRNHILLYGPQAFPGLRRVFSVPFDDPNSCYEGVRQCIETHAWSLGMTLQRRTIDVPLPPSRAATARSEVTRKHYKALVQRSFRKSANVRQTRLTESTSSAIGMSRENPQTSRRPLVELAGYTISLNSSSNISVALRECSFNPTPLPKHAPVSNTNALAFRVWDRSSRTVFDRRGFVSQLFADRQRVTAPIPMDDEYGICKVLANSHLSFQGDFSAFVSVSTSLLQVLAYAWKMDDPSIACINLLDASLNDANKMHPAKTIIRTLKREGEMPWARYKGTTEFLIWGDIPLSALLSQPSHLAELRELAQNEPDVASMLRFRHFGAHATTPSLSKRLKKDRLILNSSIAKAMGKIARLFGLGGPKVTAHHIKDCVTSMVDGWALCNAPLNNTLTMSALATSFALAIEPRISPYGIKAVMEAFVEGVKVGKANLARYAH